MGHYIAPLRDMHFVLCFNNFFNLGLGRVVMHNKSIFTLSCLRRTFFGDKRLFNYEYMLHVFGFI